MANDPRFLGILLDMDGVLLDTERVSHRCWSEAERETGVFMPEGFYFSLIGQSMPLIEQRLNGILGSSEGVRSLLEAAHAHYDRALREEEMVAKDGALALLQSLTDRQIPFCLATSTFTELAALKLRSAGLDELVPLRVCGDMIAASKPAPDIYLSASEQLALPPGRLLAIEDSENGLRSALAAGCRVIHVPDIAPVPFDLQAQAFRVYAGLDGVREAIEGGDLLFADRP